MSPKWKLVCLFVYKNDKVDKLKTICNKYINYKVANRIIIHQILVAEERWTDFAERQALHNRTIWKYQRWQVSKYFTCFMYSSQRELYSTNIKKYQIHSIHYFKKVGGKDEKWSQDDLVPVLTHLISCVFSSWCFHSFKRIFGLEDLSNKYMHSEFKGEFNLFNLALMVVLGEVETFGILFSLLSKSQG